MTDAMPVGNVTETRESVTPLALEPEGHTEADLAGGHAKAGRCRPDPEVCHAGGTAFV